MAMFVTSERVPVTVDDNTVYIRGKMDLGTRNRCLDALAVISPSGGSMESHLGEYATALMVNNILGWEGPAFAGVECTPANIARLDPDEPIVEAVLAEIGRRNPLGGQSATEKKGDTNAGGPRSKASR